MCGVTIMAEDPSNTVTAPDAAPVTHAQGDARAAFAALLRRHQAVACRACYRVPGDREDAGGATPSSGRTPRHNIGGLADIR